MKEKHKKESKPEQCRRECLGAEANAESQLHLPLFNRYCANEQRIKIANEEQSVAKS